MTVTDNPQQAGADQVDVVGDELQLANTVSIDIGGTFTDCYTSYRGQTASGKAPTTRHRLATGFNHAIAECAAKLGVQTDTLLSETSIVRYATTLAMNALLERKGPRLGLLTTAGFEDTIFIGRGAQWHDGTPVENRRLVARGARPEPVIPRNMVVGLRERVDDAGNAVISLRAESVREQVRYLVDQGAMGFVVALMHSHRNPVHEQLVRDVIVEDFPDVYLGAQPILLSSEVLPQENEYQRDMTAILAAYLHRTMAEELTELGISLRERGYTRPLFIVNSHGGANSLQRTSAVETYNAGPVAGVIGGAHIGEAYGMDNIILTDMGGTSFDIGTVVDVGSRADQDGGKHFYSQLPMIDRFRVGISMIETKSIGAGGGSIARYSPLLNIVEVGPQSAGSNPGPASFDLGGTDATVTDADLVLGYINPENFLGGQMELSLEAAQEAIRENVAEPVGTTVEEAAFMVKTLIDAKMGNEIFKETNLKGYDPREFALFAFGGAGAMHVCGYGGYVQAQQIMTFPFASVFSAYGIANTDFVRSYNRSTSIPIYVASRDHWLDDLDAFNEPVRELQGLALREATDLGVQHVNFSLELFMRFGLQPHVTRIRSPHVLLTDADQVSEVYRAFEREYGRLYSPAATFLQGGVEIVGMNLVASVPSSKLELPVFPLAGQDPSDAKRGSRPAFWGPDVGWQDTAIYHLDGLLPGNHVEGPAVIEAPDTTIVVDPERAFRVDERRNGVIEARS